MATGATPYRVILTNASRKQLATLPRDVQERIGSEILIVLISAIAHRRDVYRP